MSTQLTLNLRSKPQSEQRPIIQAGAWLDVSDIARGVGFTSAVQVSLNLNDALQTLQDEINSHYDQHLYDCLWLAYFKLCLDQSQSAVFNFTFPRQEANRTTESEIGLKLRVEAQKQVVQLGLMEDFRNE